MAKNRIVGSEDLKNVKALQTVKEIEDMKWALGRFCTPRDKFLFIFGINTGLRVSDILPLKVKDVRGKSHTAVVEKKSIRTDDETGKITKYKTRNVNLIQISDEIKEYTKGMNDDDYLFPSRKGGKPITTTQAYRQLVHAGNMLDRDDIGTHTMRKTFGFHFYKKTKDIYALMDMFNHHAESVTKRYIGIRQEELDESLVGFKL